MERAFGRLHVGILSMFVFAAFEQTAISYTIGALGR